MPTITFEQNSAGDYMVYLNGREIGHVGKVGRIWTARTVDFDVGEHPTRQAAVEALVEVDSQ